MNTIKLVVRSNTFNCDIELKHRINIIKGDSGVGKTTLSDVFTTVDDAVKTYTTYPTITVSPRDWEHQFETQKDKILIFDNVNFVESEEFYKKVDKYLEKSNQYLIIFDRANLTYFRNKYKEQIGIYEMYYDETLINHYVRELPEIPKEIITSKTNLFS